MVMIYAYSVDIPKDKLIGAYVFTDRGNLRKIFWKKDNPKLIEKDIWKKECEYTLETGCCNSLDYPGYYIVFDPNFKLLT